MGSIAMTSATSKARLAEDRTHGLRYSSSRESRKSAVGYFESRAGAREADSSCRDSSGHIVFVVISLSVSVKIG